MKIDMFNIDEFVELNHLKEITSPILLDRGGIPHPDGLISNDIFGVSVKDRKQRFAYINLRNHFFHPHIYKVIRRVFRNIDKIVSGAAYYKIENGTLIRDDENGETGINFLYENWNKLKWKGNGGMSSERAELLSKTPKDIAFLDKFPVIPVFYRDIKSASGGGGDVPEIDQFYINIIRMANLLESQEMFDFSFHATNYNIQENLVAIYDYFKDKLDRKSGMIRKFLLGKNTDFSVRTVISGPIYKGERLEDNIVDFRHASVPMYELCTLVHPFLVAWLKNFFESRIIEQKWYITNQKDEESSTIDGSELKNPESHFNDSYVTKRIDKFQKDPSSRFDKIEVPLKDGRIKYLAFTGFYKNLNAEESNLANRPMTWCDLIFIALNDIVKDKYAMITRYPVLDAFGVIFTKIRVASTLQTTAMDINGVLYKWYPLVDLNMSREKIANNFDDTLKFSNAYLKGLDGDYDGDQTSVKVLWSVEANAEAERIINSKQYFLTPAGNNIRICDIENIQTLYTLTKDPPEKVA